jgi:hypothetical protein
MPSQRRPEAQHTRDAPGERPHRDRRKLVDLADQGGVLPGDYEGMPLVDRVDVEKRDGIASLGDEARFSRPSRIRQKTHDRRSITSRSPAGR